MFNHYNEKPVRSFLNVPVVLPMVVTSPVPERESSSTGRYLAVSGEMHSFSNPMPAAAYKNSGGAWWQRKTEDDRSIFSVINAQFSAQRTANGRCVIHEPLFTLNRQLAALDNDLTLFAKGGTAISRTLPNNPSFDLATALGELRSGGLPSVIGAQLWKSKIARIRKDAGSEYLNAVFGWAPLLRDIQGFAQTVVDSEAIMNNYRSQQRRNIRVSYEFPPDNVSISEGAGNFGILPDPWGTCRASGTGYVEMSRRTWFEGAYWFYLPQGETPSAQLSTYASMAKKLLNTSVTPEVIWNVSPWSWAADWFGNTGDVLKNISLLGRDGLVLRYGYLMQESKLVETYHAEVTQNGKSIGPATRVKASVLRRRVGASPYGFGKTYDGLSASQVAVLAALGFSRS